jgi:phosphatidylglycerophosphate synthase
MCLALYFPFAPKEYRLIIVCISLLTEYFDGALSRWFKIESGLGSLLDPLADKMFVFSVILTIFFESSLTWWQLLLIGTRDAVVFLASMYLLIIERRWKIFFKVRPRLAGKAATTAQFVLLITYLYYAKFIPWLLYATISISIIAGVDYLYLLFKRNFYRDYLQEI